MPMSLSNLLSLITLSLLPNGISGEPLQCYHCINRLSTQDVTKQEQNALKSALFDRFNIPPSSEYCAEGGTSFLFQTVEKEICPNENDTCIRIVAEGDATKKLVLRGCQSTLFKSNFDLTPDYLCEKGMPSPTSLECITTCQRDLCNISHDPNAMLIPIIISLVGGIGWWPIGVF